MAQAPRFCLSNSFFFFFFLRKRSIFPNFFSRRGFENQRNQRNQGEIVRGHTNRRTTNFHRRGTIAFAARKNAPTVIFMAAIDIESVFNPRDFRLAKEKPREVHFAGFSSQSRIFTKSLNHPAIRRFRRSSRFPRAFCCIASKVDFVERDFNIFRRDIFLRELYEFFDLFH